MFTMFTNLNLGKKIFEASFFFIQNYRENIDLSATIGTLVTKGQFESIFLNHSYWKAQNKSLGHT